VYCVGLPVGLCLVCVLFVSVCGLFALLFCLGCWLVCQIVRLLLDASCAAVVSLVV
jgi:hypothetical protein